MPGTDADEAARVVLGELPALPHLVELPARGVGADMIGRTAALLVDLPVEVVPSGYRVASRPGRDHRRASDLMRRDVDALHDAVDRAGAPLPVVKVQLAGPWTLTAGIELMSGHRVLSDIGARREFAESLCEGMRSHINEIATRTGANVVVQLDEPALPTVMAGGLPTPSGYGTVPALERADVPEVLSTVVDAARSATGQPVLLHCCASRPPLSVFREAGADAYSFDATSLSGAPTSMTDELGEAIEAGVTLFLGLVPPMDPGTPSTLHGLAQPALDLLDRLGFSRSVLAEQAVPTPACGLAGASPEYARRALTLSSDLGRAFLEPPETW
jgi:methionine synthase II (cobalamin-independent)